MKFDGIFFDSGGTLFNFSEANVPDDDPTSTEIDAKRPDRAVALLNSLGRSVTRDCVAGSLKECEQQVTTRGGAYTHVDIVRELYKAQGWPEKMEEVLCVTEAYTGPRYASWLFPGTIETLRELHDLGMVGGLIANTAVPGWIFDRIWKGVGLLDYLPVRLYSGDEGVSKPNGEIFKRAAERSRLTGKRLLYVGDHPEYDIRGAKSAGWQAAMRLTEGVANNGLADFEFDDVRDLLKYVTGEE